MICKVSGRSRPSTPRPAAAGPVTAPAAAPRFDHWSVARSADGVRVFHVRVFQLRSEISRELGRRCAESAWRGVWELLREAERTGRTPAIREAAGRLMILDGCGVAGLARHTGKSRNTIRRQLGILEDMGLVRIVRPPVSMVRGPDGRLILKKGGREKPARIVVTADPDVHGKPRRKANSYGQPLTIEPAPGSGSYGQSLTTFQRCLKTTELIPPEAGTAGAGAAAAEQVVVDSTGAAEGGQEAAGAGGQEAASFEREARVGPEPEPMNAEDLMDVLTAEILAGRKGLPSPSDPGHTTKQPPHWGRKKPKPKRRIFEFDDAEPAAGQPERVSADEQARRDRNLYLAHRFAKALGITVEQVKSQWGPDLPATLRKAGIDPMTGEPLPTPPPSDRPPEAILGAAELQQQVKARRRAAADAASDRFKHEWRQEQGLPVAASTPPGRVIDAELTRMAAELDAALESTRQRLGTT